MGCLFSTGKNVSDYDENSSKGVSESLGKEKEKEKENGDNSGLMNDDKKGKGKREDEKKNRVAKSFTFRELASATKNFRQVNLIGEGGFGKVYKGRLESTGQVIAVKQLNPDGLQGNQEFIVEILMLSLHHHSNLVTLLGYCTDGDQKLLVYEYMAMGSLEDHLFDLGDKQPLSWLTRIKIAAGAARGLEYLHCKGNPPVIFRDLKSANILLDEDFKPKLSDFGLAKLGPVGDNTHVSTRVMGTYGYCAPEYAMSGKLTIRSDIYSFGVVMLELITGRKAIDITKKPAEQNLVAWARPFFRDKRKFPSLVDPLLQGNFHHRTLSHIVAIAAMCIQDEPNFRPLITDVAVALEYVANQISKSEARAHKASSRTHHQAAASPSQSNSNPSS